MSTITIYNAEHRFNQSHVGKLVNYCGRRLVLESTRGWIIELRTPTLADYIPLCIREWWSDCDYISGHMVNRESRLGKIVSVVERWRPFKQHKPRGVAIHGTRG